MPEAELMMHKDHIFGHPTQTMSINVSLVLNRKQRQAGYMSEMKRRRSVDKNIKKHVTK